MASVINFLMYCPLGELEYRSRYSDWLRAGRPRVRIPTPGKVNNFLISTSLRPALESIQPPTQWVTGAFSLGVKRPGSEANHLTPTSAEVKKMWIYASTPPYAFTASCLIREAQGQLYLCSPLYADVNLQHKYILL
jgi:hypothetical protein